MLISAWKIMPRRVKFRGVWGMSKRHGETMRHGEGFGWSCKYSVHVFVYTGGSRMPVGTGTCSKLKLANFPGGSGEKSSAFHLIFSYAGCFVVRCCSSTQLQMVSQTSALLFRAPVNFLHDIIWILSGWDWNALRGTPKRCSAMTSISKTNIMTGT